MSGPKRGGFGGGPSKRPRLNNQEEEEEERGGTFEEHLASLEDEMNYDMEDWPATEAEGPGQESTSERYRYLGSGELNPDRTVILKREPVVLMESGWILKIFFVEYLPVH